MMNMKTQVTHLAEKKLISDGAMAKSLLDQKYPGEWKIVEGELYKGEAKVNQNNEIVDLIGNLTQDNVIIFSGTRSIAATAESEGERNVGEDLDLEIQASVLTDAKPYIGESHDGGELVLYEPIKDNNGEVIGAFHIGMPKEMYDHASESFMQSIIVFGVVGVLISIAVSGWIAVRFVKPLQRVSVLTESVSIGDLRVEELSINTKDEVGKLGQSVNGMVRGLRGLVKRVQNVTLDVSGASNTLTGQANQISELATTVDIAVKEVAHGAEQQAIDTNESAKAIEEVASSIQYIADIASQVSISSLDTVERAEYGNQSVQTAIQEILQLNETTRQLAANIDTLLNDSENIGNIAAVITEIAAQTHLLALNAAIEAARAGEQGRGFTVVAGEVRKLAELSERSANEIRSLVLNVQDNTMEASNAMKLGLSQLDRGVNTIQEAGTAFEHILEASRFVAVQNREVSASTQQISAGIEEIAASMHAISCIAGQTSMNMQTIAIASNSQILAIKEINAATEGMQQSVEELNNAILHFKS